MPTIRAITATDLITLEPLLRASFGRDDFALHDELEAFTELAPKDWFALFDRQPQGFIRYFPLAEDLYYGELYVIPSPVRAQQLEKLLHHFLHHHKLSANTILRLDVPKVDNALTGMLESLFPKAPAKTFARYQLRTPPGTKKTLETPQLTEDDLETTRAILAQLKPYTVRELEYLAETGDLHVLKDNGVKAALHTTRHEREGLEIITLVTAPTQLRRGYASALLKRLLDAHPSTNMVLKVDIENTAAIKLYERAGFVRESDHTEVWWYLQLSRNPS